MATNFPTSLDALTNPTSADSLNSPDHAGQHANANDSIEALEAKVGINSSAVTTSLDYRLAQVESTSNARTFGSIALGAGSITVAALDMASGSLLTTPIGGAFEYDGKVGYFTNGSGRGLLDGFAYYANSGTNSLTNTLTTAQSMFGKVFTVQANTLYNFEIVFKTTKNTGQTASIGFGFVNSGSTITNGYFQFMGNSTASGASATIVGGYSTTITNMTNLFTANTTATAAFTIKGQVRIGANGGTLQPSVNYQTAAPGGTGTIDIGSYAMFRAVGTDSGAVSIGAWS